MLAPVRHSSTIRTLVAREAGMGEQDQQADTASCVAAIIKHCGGHVRLAAPLGLGKPNVLLNAIYAAAKDGRIDKLEIFTALSLALPSAPPGLAARFLGPFLECQFGADYPEIDYVADQRADRLPGNVRVFEFYVQSGTLLDSRQAQCDYASENYTHVARDLVPREINVVLQLAARRDHRLSLSCNPDVTLDLLDEVDAAGKPRPLLVGVVHPDLPFLANGAEVGADFFDLLCETPAPAHKLFALPREPVDNPEYAIGYHASTLVRDGGTLQIGIGALSDALVHALIARHGDNHGWRAMVSALHGDHQPATIALGGSEPFVKGLYGASEMLMDGLMRLRQAGILVRNAYDDENIERAVRDGVFDTELGSDAGEVLRDCGVLPERIDARQLARLKRFGLLPDGAALERHELVLDDGSRYPAELDTAQARAAIGKLLAGRNLSDGRYLRSAFYLGSSDLYKWLGSLDGDDFSGLDMTRVSDVNQLYGGREALDKLQRRGARFFNTCMMSTLLGAAVSDQLGDGRVVSGVGGQYNFVAMAHELDDGRSVLMHHATRTSHGKTTSNIRWNYPHTTIPRHLRDLVVTEYGVADLRGRTDAECIEAMLAISDARFAEELARTAIAQGKLPRDYRLPERVLGNTPARLAEAMAGFRAKLPPFPFGSDFDATEQKLLPALAFLRERGATRGGKLGLLLRAMWQGGSVDGDRALMERMDLIRVGGFADRLQRRLLRAALRQAGSGG